MVQQSCLKFTFVSVHPFSFFLFFPLITILNEGTEKLTLLEVRQSSNLVMYIRIFREKSRIRNTEIRSQIGSLQALRQKALEGT